MTHEAKWRVIARDLRVRIDQGVLQPGDQVPTEADLARDYGVARMTARGALVALERDGILAPGHPRTVARHHRLVVHITRTEDRLHPGESPTAGADSWVADMLAAGQEPAQRIEVITTGAGDDAAGRLGVPPGTTVTSRRLIREAGGEPHNMITFWFPREVADGTPLAEPAGITEGSLAWLEKTYGPLSHEVEWTSRMPDLDEVIALDITAPGVPVTALWRRSLTSSGQPVVTSLAIYPGDRTILRLSL
jgi:GntR family transcriptional regulator